MPYSLSVGSSLQPEYIRADTAQAVNARTMAGLEFLRQQSARHAAVVETMSSM